MKRLNSYVGAIVVLGFALLAFHIVSAATTDFTADANITVDSVTFGAGTADMLIMNGSTAESWEFSSGTFTVTNPGSFSVGSSDSTVKAININLGASLVECAVNTTPGTTSATLPTTAGTYTIEPSASTSCSSSLCSSVANAASLNTYPTCGAASCTTGYYLVGSGAGATCAQIPGAGAPAAPSSGSGASTATIGIGETRNIGSVSQSGRNLFIYINAIANFTIRVSGGNDESHSVKLSELDLANRIVELLVSSEPQHIVLSVGANATVDLNGDGINDMRITFNELTVTKVDLTLKTISSEASDLVSPDNLEGKLVKTSDSPVVYLIENGLRRQILNEQAFISQGNKWDEIMIVSDLGLYPVGSIIKEVFDTGDLVKGSGPRVYVLVAGNIKRWIVSEDVFNQRGYKWSDIISLDDLHLDQYTVGDPINDIEDTVDIDTTVGGSFTRHLNIGSAGHEVRFLQKLLKSLGYFPDDVGDTGYFGSITEDAVKKFQAANGIETVGVVGPKTRAVLNSYQ